MISKKNIVIFSIFSVIMLVPPVYADVITLETDKQVYHKDDRIAFSGTEEDGNESVSLVIKNPSGKTVKLSGDPASTKDGFFEVIPITINGVFTTNGIYEVTAFTEKQPFDTGMKLHLDFNGINVLVVDVYDLEFVAIDNKIIDEGELYTFTAKITDNKIDSESFRLGNNAPNGSQIESKTGKFTWTPTEAQGPGTYDFDIIVSAGVSEISETITIIVNEVEETIETETNEESKQTETNEESKQTETSTSEENAEKNTGLAAFVDIEKDPQHYVDRYLNEEVYKEWFDENFSQYDSIYEAVGLPEPKGLATFVDIEKDPQHYVDRYLNEEVYKEWFDENFSQYDSIYEAVGLPEPEIGICGEGTKLTNGICTVVPTEGSDEVENGGGCLIATAAYGSEMAPQVQFLREIRDNSILETKSGTTFMTGFNQFYYTFSPTIADWERQNPAFKETVKITITPLISSLAILNYVDIDSEAEMLGYGIGVIAMNIGMYFVAPAIIIWKIKNRQ